MTRINYDVPEELHQRARQCALWKGQTLKAWHERALREVVERQEAEHDAEERRRGRGRR